MIPVYSSRDIRAFWDGIDLAKGWAEDTFLTIEPNTERVNYKVGADGQIAPSKSADKSAKITVTYQQNAPVLKAIADVFAAMDISGGEFKVSPMVIIDPNNEVYFVTNNAFVSEVPTNEFGKEQGERSFVFICESYLLSSDPSTVTAAMGQYVSSG